MIQDSNKEISDEPYFKIQNTKNEYLRHEISQLKRLIFGAKSERFISNEPPLHQIHYSLNHQAEQPLENLTEEITYTVINRFVSVEEGKKNCQPI